MLYTVPCRRTKRMSNAIYPRESHAIYPRESHAVQAKKQVAAPKGVPRLPHKASPPALDIILRVDQCGMVQDPVDGSAPVEGAKAACLLEFDAAAAAKRLAAVVVGEEHDAAFAMAGSAVCAAPL